MRPRDDSIREIIKGLEGLEMLSQWQQSLVQDLRTKADALLEATHADAPPDSQRRRGGSFRARGRP